MLTRMKLYPSMSYDEVIRGLIEEYLYIRVD